MKLEELRKFKRIIIIGYGVEGQSAYNYLKKHHPFAEVGITDAKDGEDYLKKQKDFELAIKSPGVRPELVEIPYTTAMNLFFANAKGKTIGITGTKGKSTTTTLIYKMLKKEGKDVYLGGNIGKSPLDFIDNLNEDSVSVLELSSYQLNDLKYSPNTAVVLMITSEHLDYHQDIYSYIKAKRNILRFQSPEDYAIVNRDYPVANESDIYTKAKTYYVSTEREADNGCFALSNTVWLMLNGKKEEMINSGQVLLKGRHNLENVCAAVMAAALFKVKKNNIASVLMTFRGLEHRLEFVATKNSINYYNDSLSTIPESAIQAVAALGGSVETLIAGGYDRGLDYTELGSYLVKSSVKNLILFEPSGKRIWEAVVKAGVGQIQAFWVKSMDEAVGIAKAETAPEKTILLSPASASFGTFRDYKDRGEQFKKAVLELS